MASKRMVIVFLGFCLALCRFSLAQSYLSVDVSLESILAEAERVERKDVELTERQRMKIAQRLAEPFQEERLIVYIGKTKEKIDVFCLIVSSPGKHGPITFIVAITPKGTVKEISVLESMEVKGAKIGKRRFLRQFIGKSLNDPIKLRQDIDAVTGATVSSAAATKAARKALIIWEELGLPR